MCGIVFTKDKKGGKANGEVLAAYNKQSHRGKQGYGFISIDKRGTARGFQRSAEEVEILGKMASDTSPAILFHHRFPTSVPNFAEAAHPILVHNDILKYDYAVVHNGTITNWDTLFTDYKKLGFVFSTECVKSTVVDFVNREVTGGYVVDVSTPKINDSEALAVDFAYTIEGHQKNMRAYGAAAIIALQLDKETQEVVKLYYGHNSGNPLTKSVDKRYYTLKSEGGEPVEVDVLFEVDYKTLKEGRVDGFSIGSPHYSEFRKSTTTTIYKTNSYKSYEYNTPKQSSTKDLGRSDSIEEALAKLSAGVSQVENKKILLPEGDVQSSPLITHGDAHDTRGALEREHGELRQVPMVDTDKPYGYSKEAIETTIGVLRAAGDDAEVRVVDSLYDELQSVAEEENEAILEHNQAVHIYYQYKGTGSTSDLNAALDLYSSARVKLVAIKEQRDAVVAELEAHIGWDNPSRVEYGR